MSASHHTATDHLCYLHCNFCNTMLAVTLPSDRPFDIVTVRCGHCASIFSVHLGTMFQPFPSQDFQGFNIGAIKNYQMDFGSSSQDRPTSLVSSTENAERQHLPVPPPEKRHRLPSAYNKFIKEEIQRLKANNPNISHKQAFSTAAKNWAHLPQDNPDNDERQKLEELMTSPGDLKS
ncbi:axial regulator YABBY 5-like [Zingiber officinale]|uniref:axial regulator YABBY 5-like n=1 Tax=Zingiber officinale TaxID=94328 RepID=UPI001C4D3A4F|nr:axial regulator YABBY 5-like [Zingiber officinale]